MSKKNSFVGYTAEEVMAFEAATYVVQVGSDMLDVRGKMFFTKRSAYTYYSKILRELLDQLKNGTKKDKNNARRVLLGLRVLPFRVH